MRASNGTSPKRDTTRALRAFVSIFALRLLAVAFERRPAKLTAAVERRGEPNCPQDTCSRQDLAVYARVRPHTSPSAKTAGSSRTNLSQTAPRYQAPVPRRKDPDPLAELIGRRVRQLREAAGLTLEKLAYESEVGSKGYLSDIEKGLAKPTVETLQKIAHRLDLELLDLVTFPEKGLRHEVVDKLRSASSAALRKVLRVLDGSAKMKS